jgi:hypothetical protein
MEIARKDGVISDQEVEIMKQLNLDIPKYVQMLKEARKDGVIDLQEEMKLEEFKHQIIQKASNIAINDYTLSEDEKEILLKLTEIINNYFPTA